jgi:hypothetical protein
MKKEAKLKKEKPEERKEEQPKQKAGFLKRLFRRKSI